uniref:J domain-containing protein n=1 Tax=Eutreptiella gymnastica TaxID=73025 RepID=A0A7S1HWS9_9EUGL|mmetsp:Transcript_111263/g.193053  ORF Transcript_111263/g.193053 Transcript_111263/m.193053 type:complete len:417 (+) Transcript_111263:201-1451(+)
MPASDNYFEILGCAKKDFECQILKGFRAYSLRWHPRRNEDPNAVQRFAEVCEAYQILGDTRYRSLYERHGPEGLKWEGYFRDAPENVFNGFWQKYGGEPAAAIVDKYLDTGLKGGDGTRQPGDFQPTVDVLEDIQGFSKMFRGNEGPNLIDPWMKYNSPDGSLWGSKQLSAREQMMQQFMAKSGGGPAPPPYVPPSYAPSSGSQSARLPSGGGHNAQRRRNPTPPGWPNASTTEFPTGPGPSVPPADGNQSGPMTLDPGVQITVMGLQSASQHNGKVGKVVSVGTDRYTVVLDDGANLNVRPANLMQMPRVQVDEEVNDGIACSGMVRSYNADTNLYDVQLVSGKILKVKPANLTLAAKTCVMITGLQASAQYNGKWAKIISVDTSALRYVVRIDGDTQLRVRYENARICTPPLGI